MRYHNIMRKVVFAFLLIPVITFGAAAEADAASLPKGLENALHHALVKECKATHTPGAIAGVWEEGKGSWRAVWGVASTATKRPPVFGDVTRIGSITKTFTTTMILLLVKKHELSLDDTVGRWFPNMPDGDKITIRMLGNMSSGIGDYVVAPKFNKPYFDNPHQVWTPRELVKIGLGMPRKYSPGKGFNYSNTNTVMLQLIIQDVTHKPFAKDLKQMILQPLGLTHTGYPTTGRLPKPHWQGYASPNPPWRLFPVKGKDHTVVNTTNWSPSFGAAAGQMISTLNDLHRWSVALGTGALLTPALQKERLLPNPSMKPDHAYCFGFMVLNGWIFHNGEVPGFNTVVAYFPASRSTIVVMANTNAGMPADEIFKALATVVGQHHAPHLTP